MPESPNFEDVALRMVVELSPLESNAANARPMMVMIAERLRLIWNARGAADLAALETAYHPAFGNEAPSMKTLAAAIRRVDRGTHTYSGRCGENHNRSVLHGTEPC